MSNRIFEKMETEYNKSKSKFIGYYSGYATSLRGDDIVEAIKYFYSHYNAILSIAVDFDNQIIYKGSENDEPDVRGYYNYSYYNNDTNECVYNRDEATRPLNKVKPSQITKFSEHGYIARDGKFYGCGFEGHRWLADELFLTNTIPLKEVDKHKQCELVLEKLGWVKISSKRIHYLRRTKRGRKIQLTISQKKTVVNWLDKMGGVNYEYQGLMRSKDEIITRLYE